MQTIGDGTDERIMGAIPKRDRQVSDRPLFDEAVGRMGGGLDPIRIETPLPQEGLRPVSFTDGLDEISVDALRANGRHAPLARGVHHAEALRAAARRAGELGLMR